MDETLNDEITRTLFSELFAVPAKERIGRTWVMSQGWWHGIRRLKDPSGIPLWTPNFTGPVYLLGYPVEVREDAQGIYLVLPDHQTERSTS